jgi:hypothetical protein
MRKFALFAVLAAALAVPSVAAAFAGTLTGVGTIGGATPFDLGVGISEGGAAFFGLENDHSGACTDDTGTVTINGALTFNIVCAHFVASSRGFNAGSPKMRFAWGSGPYNVARITDNGLNLRAPTDTFAVGTVNTLAEAIAWVNTGAVGSGHSSPGWDFRPVLINSDYAVG